MLRARRLNRPSGTIALRAPVILMVLAATAIPIEIRPLGQIDLGFHAQSLDFVANVAGYAPIGLALSALGSIRAVVVAGAISMFAETCQLGMAHRDPSVSDVLANMIGAIVGVAISRRWNAQPPQLSANRPRAIVAIALVLPIMVGVWASAGGPVNPRGDASPGALEAHWKLDENRGRLVQDTSGNELTGRFSREPFRSADATGAFTRFDGRNDYVDFRRPSPLRLAGSMSISAWINAASFPVDDAAVVSSLRDGGEYGGFQLDTTIDRGPRTIGFKIADACGGLMARYGATPLALDTWYHLAGVYDATTQSLDVYLNGELDNGFLLGSVTATQRSSRSAVYVGRRSDLRGFEFAGSIRDVRIYSRALTGAELLADMQNAVHAPEASELDRRADKSAGVKLRNAEIRECRLQSDYEDKDVPVAAAAIGVLVAFACVGLWPSVIWPFTLVASLASGCLLLLATSATLPPLNLWTVPLTSLLGGACIAFSFRPRTKSGEVGPKGRRFGFSRRQPTPSSR